MVDNCLVLTIIKQDSSKDQAGFAAAFGKGVLRPIMYSPKAETNTFCLLMAWVSVIFVTHKEGQPVTNMKRFDAFK